MENPDEIITIKNYYSDIEADFAKNILESNGIPAVVAGRTSMWAGGGASFSPKLQVKRRDAERANEILGETKQTVEEKNVPMIKREFPWLIKTLLLYIILFVGISFVLYLIIGLF